MHPQEISSEKYLSSEFQVNRGKLRPTTRAYRILNVIVLLVSLFYLTLSLRDANWNTIAPLLALIDIFAVNGLFFWLTNLGERRLGRESRMLFYSVSFISAVLLVYISRMLPEGMIYFLAAWMIAVLLNMLVYNFCTKSGASNF